MMEICSDNRFELIAKYKQKLIEATNIETSPEEMAVIDAVLFRCWQMGWLDTLEKQAPRKALHVYKSWDSGYVKHWTCPNCGKEHSAEYRPSCADDVCDECHQLIDWSDNE